MRFMVLHPEFDDYTPPIHALHTLAYTQKKPTLTDGLLVLKRWGCYFNPIFFSYLSKEFFTEYLSTPSFRPIVP